MCNEEQDRDNKYRRNRNFNKNFNNFRGYKKYYSGSQNNNSYQNKSDYNRIIKENYNLFQQIELNGRIENKEIRVMFDIGATRNFISEKLINEL